MNKTCADCIHYESCCDWTSKDVIDMTSNAINEGVIEECKHFKDKSRFIELPCAVGDTVYCVYYEKVIQGTVRLIRPFVSKDDVVFKGNIICEIDSLFWDDGRKEEIELYVVFEKPYGMERVAYFIKEDAEAELKKKGGVE